jgi:polyisoprenoid-binding protein YceI
MRTLILSIMMIAFSAVSLNAQKYNADVKKSTLAWHAKKVTGEHFGNISLKSGNLEIANEQILKGKFIIDMTSITNSDLTDATYNAKLVNHLKSDDFFGVATHPEAVIEIVKAGKFVNNEATVEANLTIKSITHPVTFKVTQQGLVYSATIVVDRAKYDVRYGSGSFFDGLGDKLIYDEFEMTVKIEVNQFTDKQS